MTKGLRKKRVELDFNMVALCHLKVDINSIYSMVVLKGSVKEISSSAENKWNAISMFCLRTTFHFINKAIENWSGDMTPLLSYIPEKATTAC